MNGRNTCYSGCIFCTSQALRNKRQVEQLYEDAQSKINEITTINVNLAASRSKLEQELGQLAADFEEAHKELRVRNN